VECVEVDSAVLVDDLCALGTAGLPHAEDRALRVSEDCHPTRVNDIERRCYHLAACCLYFGDRFIRARDSDVGVPRRYRRVISRKLAYPGGAAAANRRDEKPLTWGLNRRNELPAEQAAVERQHALRILITGIDPARHAGDVLVTFRHLALS
jgi:hypothetical protein